MSLGFSSGSLCLTFRTSFILLSSPQTSVLCLPGRGRELISEHLRSTRHIYPQSSIRSSW